MVSVLIGIHRSNGFRFYGDLNANLNELQTNLTILDWIGWILNWYKDIIYNFMFKIAVELNGNLDEFQTNIVHFYIYNKNMVQSEEYHFNAVKLKRSINRYQENYIKSLFKPGKQNKALQYCEVCFLTFFFAMFLLFTFKIVFFAMFFCL